MPGAGGKPVAVRGIGVVIEEGDDISRRGAPADVACGGGTAARTLERDELHSGVLAGDLAYDGGCRVAARVVDLRGRTVVRLKGGDPHLFGRAAEEIEACRAAGLTVITVPGVSAGFAAAAALGASLTARGVSRSVAFVTPSSARPGQPDINWARAAASAETAVLYMGAAHAQLVHDTLIGLGVRASQPVALIESASWAEEKVIRGALADLPALASRLGGGPAIIVMGEAAAQARSALDAANAA